MGYFKVIKSRIKTHKFWRFFTIGGSQASYSPQAYPTTNYELVNTLILFTLRSFAILNPASRASYLARLFNTSKVNLRAYLVTTPFKLVKISPALLPYKLEVPST